MLEMVGIRREVETTQQSDGLLKDVNGWPGLALGMFCTTRGSQTCLRRVSHALLVSSCMHALATLA
jgi:hypothetical protein